MLSKFPVLFASILLIMGAIYSTSNQSSNPQTNNFNLWKKKFNKVYGSSFEQLYRFMIYSQNQKIILQHNSLKGIQYKMGTNQFSDITSNEFQNTYLYPFAFNQIQIQNKQVIQSADIDWVSAGAVTSVKNQGACSSCWAFATVGSIEGLVKITSGKLQEFSAQQLIDCSASYGNLGCNGGLIEYSMRYITDKGLNLQRLYPYEEKKNPCKISQGPYKISGYKKISSCTDLSKALTERPVAVAVDASNWVHYSSGIFSNCKSSLNYNVLVVGIKDGNWVAKNVWGQNWGQNGYIRIKGGNTCGICNLGYSPNK